MGTTEELHTDWLHCNLIVMVQNEMKNKEQKKCLCKQLRATSSQSVSNTGSSGNHGLHCHSSAQ